MKIARLVLLIFSALLVACALPAREETLRLYEDHLIAIAVPEGYSYAKDFGEDGIISVRITDPKQEFNLQISFLPDPEARLAIPRVRKEFMAESFEWLVESSVERAMQFEEFPTATDHCTYCVFTDASLVGKKDLPRDEYLKATVGIKAWSKCGAIFTLLSNDTQSEAYRAALKIITGLRDKAPPATL